MRVEDIHTYYGNSYILQGLSLAIAPGETVAVLGRNGVGKTTLVRSIIGFTPPARGRIFLNDDIVSGLAPEWIARRGVALVPQGRRIFRSLTVEETLSIAARRRPEMARQPQWSLSAFTIYFRDCANAGQRSETLRRRTTDAGDRTRALSNPSC
jgi:branched-chain amino acid transport system ATP-binding protein